MPRDWEAHPHLSVLLLSWHAARPQLNVSLSVVKAFALLNKGFGESVTSCVPSALPWAPWCECGRLGQLGSPGDGEAGAGPKPGRGQRGARSPKGTEGVEAGGAAAFSTFYLPCRVCHWSKVDFWSLIGLVFLKFSSFK